MTKSFYKFYPVFADISKYGTFNY